MNKNSSKQHWRSERLEKPLPGKWYGQLQSLLTGGGVSFHDPRRYQSGDARKHINRKLSAKHQHRYVNTQEHERLSELHLLLDINVNRRGGTTKLWTQIISEWLADLALVTQAYHTKVFVTFPSQEGLTTQLIQTLPQWGALLEQLLSAITQCPRVYQTALSEYRQQCAHFTKQRLAVLVSDFLDVDAQTPSLRFFQEKHVVLPVRLDIPLAWTTGGLQASIPDFQTMLGSETLVLGN